MRARAHARVRTHAWGPTRRRAPRSPPFRAGAALANFIARCQTGVDFLEKTIDLEDGESVKLMIWDTAGQEEFDALTSSYYRGSGAVALVFSTIDRASFEAVEKWKKKIEAECGDSIVMAMVQNKVRRGGRRRRRRPLPAPPCARR